LIGPKTNQQQATNPLRTPGKQDGNLRFASARLLIPTSRLLLHKASVPQKTHCDILYRSRVRLSPALHSPSAARPHNSPLRSESSASLWPCGCAGQAPSRLEKSLGGKTLIAACFTRPSDGKN